MPSTSKKQHNFMAAVANNPSFAKKVGVPQSVGQDFNKADKGRKFSKGGDMAESKAMVKKEMAFMKKKGAPASMIKHEKAEAGMKKGGMPAALAKHAAKPASKAHAGLKAGGMTKMAPGGMARTLSTGNMAKTVMPGSRNTQTPVGPGFNSRVLPQRDNSMQRMPVGGVKPMAKGGGIETKGKTKGAMVKMKSGGRYC
jgi:hypothetical protein